MTDYEDDDQEGVSNEFGLVMPFVACETNGGSYDDRAFVAGYECGSIDATLRAIAPMAGQFARFVSPDLVRQLDLIAMQHNYVTLVEVQETTDEWVLVTFSPIGIKMPEETDDAG